MPALAGTRQRSADRTSSLIGSPGIGSPPVTSSTLTRRPARRRAARASIIALAGVALLHGGSASPPPGPGEPHHPIALHGEPALAEGFKAARYVNPEAPKGGRLVEGVL